MKARLWIDFWNFQTCLDEQMPGARVDFVKVGSEAAARAVSFSHDWAGLTCIQTRMFASRPPMEKDLEPAERAQANWLVGLQHRRGAEIAMFITPRVFRSVAETCEACGHVTSRTIQQERAVDMALAMDAIRIVVDGDGLGKADAVILASQDYDFAHAVRLLQRWGIPVINLGFQHGGNRLAEVCDALVTVQELGDACLLRRSA